MSGTAGASEVDIVVCTKFSLRMAIQNQFSAAYSHEAVYDLAEQDPEMSAQIVFTPMQLFVGWGLARRRSAFISGRSRR